MLPKYYMKFLKDGLISVDQGTRYGYIYSVIKNLYKEDANFKKLLARIRMSDAEEKTFRKFLWSLYRVLFSFMASRGRLKIAAFLLWRQLKPWVPDI